MKNWDVVMITASSERQAGLYREEIQRRRLSGMLPEETQFLVVPDPGDRRVGSGGATINALGVLGKKKEWWSCHRALLIHSGGDSRRLPQYSPGGKLPGTFNRYGSLTVWPAIHFGIHSSVGNAPPSGV